MIRLNKGVRLAAAALAAAAFLTGCKASFLSGSGTRGCYNMAQTMIVVSTERNRYERVYTDAVWNVQTDGVRFEDYLLDQVEVFLENMKAMNLLAEERSVELSQEDEELMELAAREYFDALTEADREALGVSEKDAEVMFKEYCLANQLVESLTSEMNLEVSDNEAKVIVIKEGRTGDSQAAQQAAAALSQEDADFDSVMSAAGIPVAERRLGRGEADAAYEDAVFSLETGAVSGQLTDGDSFCFVQCVNSFDEEATKVRKEQIFEERRKNAFAGIYEQFGAEVKVAYPENFFEDISFDKEAAGASADFFAVYNKYKKPTD